MTPNIKQIETIYTACICCFFLIVLSGRVWPTSALQCSGHLPGTSSRRSQRPAGAWARCISPPWPPSLSSSCRSGGMLPQSDYYWDLIADSVFRNYIYIYFFSLKIVPAKSFWSHGRFLMAGSFEKVTWNLKIFKMHYT